MYLLYKETYTASVQPVSPDLRNYELAELLLNGLGYESAMKKAKESHWDNVAGAIRFLASQSSRSF